MLFPMLQWNASPNLQSSIIKTVFTEELNQAILKAIISIVMEFRNLTKVNYNSWIQFKDILWFLVMKQTIVDNINR